MRRIAHLYLQLSMLMNSLSLYLKVILFDLDSAYRELGKWKWELFDKTKIGIPDHDHESHRAVLFGFLTTALLGIVSIGVISAGCRHDCMAALTK